MSESPKGFHAELELLLENVPDAVFVEDMKGNVLYANSAACQLHEMSHEELIGKNVLDLVPPEARDSVAADFEGWRSGDLREYQGHSYTKTGRRVPVEIRANKVQFQGSPALILNVRDVSERIAAEQEKESLTDQLQHTQKLESLGVMAGGIAHDFNNLLMGILGNTELALDDADEGSPLFESLRGIENSAMHAAELCRQMLAYAGRGKSRIERININDAVAGMSQLLVPSGTKKARLEYELTTDTPDIEGDPSQIQQVVMNLVTNASEALEGSAGVITMSTGVRECDAAYFQSTWLADPLPAGPYVYIRVADSGTGMDENALSRIFDPFFTTKFTGRGLGLAVVLGIVRGHQGAIHVESKPGSGSTFTILFPAPTSSSTIPARAKSDRKARTSGRVLLVDDEDAVLTVTRRMLERMHLEVVVAHDGAEAVKIFREQPGKVSCVLLDLSMPEMDGMEALTVMREVRDDVPVILMSGYDRKEAISHFADVDLQGFLQKPFRRETLREAMESIIRL